MSYGRAVQCYSRSMIQVGVSTGRPRRGPRPPRRPGRGPDHDEDHEHNEDHRHNHDHDEAQYYASVKVCTTTVYCYSVICGPNQSSGDYTGHMASVVSCRKPVPEAWMRCAAPWWPASEPTWRSTTSDGVWRTMSHVPPPVYARTAFSTAARCLRFDLALVPHVTFLYFPRRLGGVGPGGVGMALRAVHT